MIFIKIGYHPIAGLAMAYASSLGGFGANFLIGMQDALVYAFTEPATKIVSDSVKINVAMNWYFIAASVILVLPVIYFTTTKVVIPRLGEYMMRVKQIMMKKRKRHLILRQLKRKHCSGRTCHFFY